VRYTQFLSPRITRLQSRHSSDTFFKRLMKELNDLAAVESVVDIIL